MIPSRTKPTQAKSKPNTTKHSQRKVIKEGKPKSNRIELDQTQTNRGTHATNYNDLQNDPQFSLMHNLIFHSVNFSETFQNLLVSENLRIFRISKISNISGTSGISVITEISKISAIPQPSDFLPRLYRNYSKVLRFRAGFRTLTPPKNYRDVFRVQATRNQCGICFAMVHGQLLLENTHKFQVVFPHRRVCSSKGV